MTSSSLDDRLTSDAFDAARLARKVDLTGPEAAFYLGYTRDSHRYPYRAFWQFVQSHGVPHFHLGRRLRFPRVHLDALKHRLPAAMAAAQG